MRNVSRWCQGICKALRESTALQEYVTLNLSDKIRQREIKRLARLIADVELGLTLLEQVATGEPATSVSALLSGYRYAVQQLETDSSWQMTQIARFYLVRIKGKQWERAVEEYLKLPQVIRVYSLEAVNSVPRLIPSSTAHNRSQVYRQTLNQTPEHKKWTINLATEGRWFCKISKGGHSPVEVPIDIPAAVATIALSPQVSLLHTRNAHNPPATVTWSELLQTAQEMDRKFPKGNWYTRLARIALLLYDAESDDFQAGNDLKLDQLIHIVGLLNVGKSSLLEVLTYLFASRGYRCALVVNDVVTAVRTASMFWHKLGIEAAPVMGERDRQKQLEKVYETIFIEEGEEIAQGGVHPALRWFSPVCPLLALVQSEVKWAFGQEPCHTLYREKSQVRNGDFDLDDGDEEDKKVYTCPLYYRCPRHQLERDIATAKIWVLTPASFIHTRVPRQVFESKLTFAEAVYRECDFLFVDEADRVQVQFDDAFAPEEVLVDASEDAYLNKLGQYAGGIYQSAREQMVADRLVAWLSAQYYAQNATNRIYNRLLTQEKLVEWLGSRPFTGRSLFAKIIRELTKPVEERPQKKSKQTRQQRIEALRQSLHQRITSASLSEKELQDQRRKLLRMLEEFIENPVTPRSERELSTLALRLLGPENDKQALAEVQKWCRKWLDQIKASAKNIDFEELTRNVHFAILTTVLDNQLTYLVDHMPYVRPVLDLQDLEESLLKRPPFDYLPVVPDSPVGNILGFFYTRDANRRNYTGGKLDYFRYVGVGRALLLRFPTLFAVDRWDGPHTVLISGTSYAPGSPAYHINVRPDVLLQPKIEEGFADDTGIGASRFFFSPVPGYGGLPIAVSGFPPQERKQNIRDMTQILCISETGGLSLNDVFHSLHQQGKNNLSEWADRERILMVTGSYDEAEWVHSIMQPLCPDKHIEPLRRDQAPPNLRGIRRSKIQSLKDTSIQGVVAPLMALERGYNVLNQSDKAAFGAALFLNRPMPVPDNWQSTVQQLNDWALKHERYPTLFEGVNEPLTLLKAADVFYLHATEKMRELNYSGLRSDEVQRHWDNVL